MGRFKWQAKGQCTTHLSEEKPDFIRREGPPLFHPLFDQLGKVPRLGPLENYDQVVLLSGNQYIQLCSSACTGLA